jgi:hypothetical protein
MRQHRCHICRSPDLARVTNAKNQSFCICNGCGNIFHYDPILIRVEPISEAVGRVLGKVLAHGRQVHRAPSQEQVELARSVEQKSVESKPKATKPILPVSKVEAEVSQVRTAAPYWR